MSSRFRPADLHAPGGIDALLAFHRATFGGWQMVDPPAPADMPAAPVGTPPTPPAAPATPPPAQGYPDNVSVDQMKPEQQAAYYKAQAAKHEGRATKNYATLRELGITDADSAAQVLQKIRDHDALVAASATDAERAVAEAKKAAKTEAEATYRPLLVAAKFEAAAAGRIPAEQLAAILEPLDLTKFLTDSGTVDAAKVATYVEQVAPAKGNGRQVAPTTFGLGSQPPPAQASGAQGLAQAQKRGYVKPPAA